MILSASRRTDIPCYYAEWFMNRIRAGYILTRNPMNHSQISRIPLTPETVDMIVFWTKDPDNMLSHLSELDDRGYAYCFQFTVTPYGNDLEANLRPKSEIENTFIALSRKIGRERVIWRYDPILLNDRYTASYHKEQFLRMCDKLSSYTDTVTVSFIDMYAKLKTTLLRPASEEEIQELSAYVGECAKRHGLKAVACCENVDLTSYGIGKAACIDKTRIERILGCPLTVGTDKNQRIGCGCCESIDIGSYDTCLNGCVYCYANHSPVIAQRRHASHDPSSPILIGRISDTEKITDRKTASLKATQLTLF